MLGHLHTQWWPDHNTYGICTSWWRHQMETFPASLAICAGNSPVNSPHKGQWRGALMLSLICVWINDWVNNREAGDLRRHRTHYDVIVMCYIDHLKRGHHDLKSTYKVEIGTSNFERVGGIKINRHLRSLTSEPQVENKKVVRLL